MADDPKPPVTPPTTEPTAPTPTPAVIPPPRTLVEGEIEASGAPGKPFSVTGLNLGPKGTVSFGGQTVETTAWYTREHDKTTMIKGVLPADVAKGEVLVVTGGKTYRGWFGPKPAGKK
jgi:hypothetical protein